MVHVTQIPDPYHAEWYDVVGQVIGFLPDADGETMVVKVSTWRPAERIYRDGGWIHTESVRFPLLVLRWVGNDYSIIVEGGENLTDDDLNGDVKVGSFVGFMTNRREQDDYATIPV